MILLSLESEMVHRIFAILKLRKQLSKLQNGFVMLKKNRYDFAEELIDIIDKYVDCLSYRDISEELIRYATRMMLSLEDNELSGLKAILGQVVKGMEMYERYHS